jgi:RNAse (barnase) inhibitor barstar
VTTMSAILAKHAACGLYALQGPLWLSSIEQIAKEHNLAFFVLAGARAGSKKEFMDQATRVFGFPDYFGKNWDAFADCLTDMSWVGRNGFLIVYSDCRQFADRSPEDFDTAIEIFKEAADFWKKEGKTFLVLFHDSTERDLGFPLITP